MACETRSETESCWSLAAFWLVAFSAAALFAAVLIAPKWEQTRLLRSRLAVLTHQCQHLARANDRLDRLAQALKHDPDFVMQVARCELDYGLAGELRIPAPCRPWGQFDSRRPEPPELPSPWWQPVAHLFAADAVVRESALFTAAVLVIVGLAFFNPPRSVWREPLS